jgi:hypothetical protein
MIALARAQEAEHRLGIDYIVGDARELTLGVEYDLAVAAYLLNYARDRAELGAMCNGIAHCLRPGGPLRHGQLQPGFGLPSRALLSEIWIRNDCRRRVSRGSADYMDFFPGRHFLRDRKLLSRCPNPFRRVRRRSSWPLDGGRCGSRRRGRSYPRLLSAGAPEFYTRVASLKKLRIRQFRKVLECRLIVYRVRLHLLPPGHRQIPKTIRAVRCPVVLGVARIALVALIPGLRALAQPTKDVRVCRDWDTGKPRSPDDKGQ